MDMLGDDELYSILRRVSDSRDRKSCSEVSKQWARAEGLTRSFLRLLDPQFLPSFLPRFPNLTTFESCSRVSDPNLDLLAHTCPSLKTLNLNLHQTRSGLESFDDIRLDEDFGDDGLRAVAAGCRRLTKVFMRRRKGIGDSGIASLVSLAKNLTVLDLSWCSRITDEALGAIGAVSSLSVLCLHGCSLVTDSGLASLSNGPLLSRSIRRLDLSECDRISDNGVMSLRKLSFLQELDLAECGPKVTDAGIVAIASVSSLRRLSVKWLINLSDAAVLALARDCQYLVELDVTGCELITGAGIRAFSGHGSLEILVLASCYNLTVDDVAVVVSGCPTLRYVGLDRVLRGWMSSSVYERLSGVCRIGWL
ncbi:F-box protein At5g07670-like [Typha angustifolia]|uniref:F-box protein At5g07670-like n=1 Tax=Typha angustifolia TaxID=59011 RepID=UPI003C2EEE1D